MLKFLPYIFLFYFSLCSIEDSSAKMIVKTVASTKALIAFLIH